MSSISTGITLKPKKQPYTYYLNASAAKSAKENEKTKKTPQEQIQENESQISNENINNPEPEPAKKQIKAKKVKKTPKEKKLWEKDGSLLIEKTELNKPEEKELTPEEERAKENEKLRNRMQKNLKLAQDFKEKANNLKNINKEEEEQSISALELRGLQSPAKPQFKPNKKEFYKRQQKSAKVRKDFENATFVQKKPEISAGSKAILKQSPSSKKRKIENDYKRPKKEVVGEEYSFHPDQTATLDYPIRVPRFSIIDDMRLLNSISEAKQSTLLVEKELVIDENDVGLRLETDPRDTLIKAKRCLKRKERKAKEMEELAKLKIKDPEVEKPEQHHFRTKMPKAQREMNELFALFKAPLDEDMQKNF